MGMELLKKIANGMDGSIMEGGAENEQKEQIQEENKKPEKEKKENKKSGNPFAKKEEKPTEGNGQVGPIPTEKVPGEVPPAGAEAVPAENNPTPPIEGEVAPAGGGQLGVSQIIDFLQANPSPDDSAVHAFAEQNGADVHQLEAAIYGLSTKMVNMLRGGKMIDKGLDVNSVDPRELEAGVAVEMEHTPDPAIAKKIALDHLAEIPDYYTRLKAMEAEAKNEAGAAMVPVKEKPEMEEPEEKKENDPNIPVGANNRTEY